MIESALSFIVFMAMFLGILDFGQFLYFHQTLIDRARAGVRYAAINYSASQTAVQQYVVYNDAAVTSGTPTVAGLTTSMVSLTRSGTNGTPDATVRVVISGYPINYLSLWIAGVRTTAVAAVLPSEAP
jgi:hypothetical protein